MAFSFVVNIVACLILIPIFKNEGAATAYTITVVAQLILYMWKKTMDVPKNKRYYLFYGLLPPPVPGSLHICISTILLEVLHSQQACFWHCFNIKTGESEKLENLTIIISIIDGKNATLIR